MNMFTAVNNALHIALQTDDSAILFGQDVAFGGVFRCSQHLRETFGPDRVFNTPLSEVGIAGLAIGYAATANDTAHDDAEGKATAIAEIQFADYIFPALDQICNELAKFRYRSGNQWSAGGVTIRTPYGAVGHGGHYHSQSPEACLAHTPGLTVVMPRSPRTAKGLLLASIRSPNPVIFLEPKALYRAAVEDVPIGDYELPLSTADVVQHGTDVTVIGWGGQVRVLQAACDVARKEHGISCELIDLQTIVPWDVSTVIASVHKTGKCVVSHEAPITAGFGAEVVATIQQRCFWSLQAPIQRVCGYDLPFPLVHEKLYVPNALKNVDAIVQCMKDAK
jgi:2-oxoisovalerate dehydrogenase E1 component beta subunit